jgi:hypothetical protein
MILADSGDTGGRARKARARHHGEPSSPLGAEGSASEPPTLQLDADPTPYGGWGAERAELGATYGDRRAMQARPRLPRPAPGVTAFGGAQ